MAYVYPAPTWQQEVLYNSGNNRLTFDFVHQNAKANLTSATIQLRDPAGNAIGSSAAMTASAAQAYYVLSTTTTATWPIQENYIADVTAVASGLTIVRRHLFDVCYTILHPLLTEDHLTRLDPLLDDSLPYGESTFAKYVGAAWSKVMNDVRNRGNRPALILSSEALIEPHMWKACQYYCEAQAQNTGSVWMERARGEPDGYLQRYATSLSEALSHAKYDSAQDGLANEGLSNLSSLRMYR